MQTNNINVEDLLNNLPQFGLNPNDWRLLKLNSKNFVLKHKEDSEVCLLGKLDDNESYHWQELQWLSL